MRTHHRPIRWLAVALLLLSVSQLPLSAQVRGRLTGTVRDANGDMLPGATVTVKGEALQRESAVSITDSNGRYRIGQLSPGDYEVSVELQGFATETNPSVRVGINETVSVDWTLRLETVSETVVVTSTVAAIEVTRSELATRIDAESIENLPLNGRDFEDLVNLAPGVKPRPSAVNDQQFSIFGERPSSTGFVVDGTDNYDPLDGGAFQRYSQDAIQEFEIITSGYEAQFGRSQGGIVNVVTRSGTNRWRGSAFYFVRDDSFDSSNISGQDPAQLERDQYGASLGGPLKRDKAFIFLSAEQLDEARGRNIDFSRLQPWVASGLATPGGGEDFDAGPESDGFTILGKVDYVTSDALRFSLSYNNTDDEALGEIPSGIAGSLVLPSGARTRNQESDSLALRNTWVIDTNAFLDSNLKFLDGQIGNNLDRQDRGETALLLFRSGFVQTGAPVGGRQLRDTERLQLSQSYTRLLADGQHELKIGYDYIDTTLDGFNEVWNDVEYSAAFLFPNQSDIMEDHFSRFGFEQAAARFFNLSANPDGRLDLDISNEDVGVFIQDKWQVNERFAVDLGLRWDRASLFGDDDDNFAPRFGFTWDTRGDSKTIVKGSAGIFYDQNALIAAATVPEKGGIFTKNAFDVALPRLGFVYSESLIDLVITSGFPTGGGGRTPAENPLYLQFADDLRNDPLHLYNLFGISVSDPNNPPTITADNIQQLSGLSPGEALALLQQTYPGTIWDFYDVPGGSVLGDRVLSFFPRGPISTGRSVSVFSEDQTPETVAATLSVEHQFADNYVVTASYVYRRTDDLLTRRIVNLVNAQPGESGFGQTTDGGPFQNAVTYEGEIDYDGFTLSLRRPFTGRFGFTAAYTYSDNQDNLLTGEVGSGFSNNNNPDLDFGDSNLSVPSIFVGSITTLLPLDFRLSGVLFYRDGNAFSPRGIVDTDGDGLVDQRDLSIERNSLRVDDFISLDVRLEKPFALPNGDEINILVDVFNVTNEDNVANVNSVSGPDFGVPVDFFPGREIQVGLRYYFGGR